MALGLATAPAATAIAMQAASVPPPAPHVADLTPTGFWLWMGLAGAAGMIRVASKIETRPPGAAWMLATFGMALLVGVGSIYGSELLLVDSLSPTMRMATRAIIVIYGSWNAERILLLSERVAPDALFGWLFRRSPAPPESDT